MMNGGKSIIFSRGIQMTNINGQVNKQEYEAIYDGKMGKMILNDNNKKYYIEADEDDIANLLNKPKSNENLEKKLKKLVKKPKKKKRIRIKTPSKKKRKIHYTVKKKTPSKRKKSPSKRKTKRKKTPTKKKKSPSKKKTTQRLLPDDLLKTII